MLLVNIGDMMDFCVDFLYVCLFFPIWACLLICANWLFTAINSKRMVAITTMLGCVFPLIFAIWARVGHVEYSHNFVMFAINDINFYSGLILNKLNLLLTAIFSVISLIATVYSYFEFREKSYFYKYFLLLNVIIFLGLGFILSSNLLQLFITGICIPLIFYVIENMTNENHERAKNYLVMNKIGDFTLFATLAELFYFNTTYDFQQKNELFNLANLNDLFESIYSVTDIQFFILLSFLVIIGILIKTVLTLIHPMKENVCKYYMLGINILALALLTSIFYPVFINYQEIQLFLFVLAPIVIVMSIVILMLKKFNHNFIVKVNNTSSNIIKTIYLKIANCVRYFDENFIDKIYETISKITLYIAGCFKINTEKNTIWALVFNICGILFLILIVWLLYVWYLKG